MVNAIGDGKLHVPLLKGPGDERFGRVLDKSGDFLKHFFGSRNTLKVFSIHPRRPNISNDHCNAMIHYPFNPIFNRRAHGDRGEEPRRVRLYTSSPRLSLHCKAVASCFFGKVQWSCGKFGYVGLAKNQRGAHRL
ncbi:MAG: hypothetical protein ABSB74_20185, partial [Tepidisphaeraceae bacterium]